MASATKAPESGSPTASTPIRRGISASLPPATVHKWLKDMLLIREFEIRCAQAYQQAKIGGFCHLYIGQEACAIGTINSVNPDDPVVTAYRDHGHALARGMDAGACMAEMFGKATGCAKGKGGSMHMFDRPHWLFGGHGIVGAQTALGAGLAFGARYEWEVLKRSVSKPDGSPAAAEDKLPAKKKVCLCYLGDGALNQGVLHESMNLAGLWNLPVIYIVENNRYSMGTAIERGTTMAHDLRAKGAAYGIESLKISEDEGLDVLRLYDKFKPFADECREKQRPGFVDLHTYRYQGHSMSDPQKYRTKEEVEGVKKKDSIDQLALYCMNERKSLTEEQFIAMQREVKDIVAHAVKFAEESSAPELSELYTDVYANPQPNLSPIREYTHGAKNPLL
ncbi:MAG TPA: pyruvate dehydrogenase (acetyl-transferring) E1 component subunit alpha [Phycisphaerales bacterium]|nr:pyruvate dehydrogenase (acetyl-transferring) E1 component subunit alpha [Phycisphaerales bacterium]